jgi:hypothetical protein
MENVNMEAVESSNIDKVGYNPTDKTLYIQFKGGSTYKYHPITQHGYTSLRGAESVGRFFHQHIRNNSAISTEKI